MNILSVSGIIYDIVGAFLLARALVFAKDKILAAQSASVLNCNPALFAALEEQRHDARFGLWTLIAGFVLQLVAAFGCFVSTAFWPWFAVVLVVILATYFATARRMKSTRDARLASLMKGVKKIEDLR